MRSDIPNVKNVLSYSGKKTELVSDDDQSTDKIIEHIRIQHDLDKPKYDSISEHFWQGNAKDTARLLFDHQKKYVQYKEESPEEQTVKSPGAILHQGHGDCKHYALFITGVAESLARKGYPIRGKYRFIADRPGMDFHHVFSIVTDDKGKSYWTDPVLKSFDERPKFHKTKDAVMSGTIGSISRITGTKWDTDIPNVAGGGVGKKHNNIFKKIAHGIDVNAKNIKHGAEVNLKNVKKEIKKAGDKVKHIALKVSLAAMRGPFLALVDLNAFNLAHRLHDTIYGPDTKKRDGLFNKWYEKGGEKNTLIKAVHNGFRHYQKKHHVKNMVYGIGEIPSLHQILQDHKRMADECRCHIHRPRMRADHGISGTVLEGVGVAPLAIPAMLTLASAIIAAVKPYLKHSPGDDKAMAEGKEEGADALIKNSSDGIDVANGEKGEQAVEAMQALTKKSGMPTMEVSTGTDETGAPQLTVHAVSHPLIDKAAKGEGNSYDADTAEDSDTPGIPKKNDRPMGENFLDSAKSFVSEHKTLVIGGAAATVAVILISQFAGKKKRR